MGCELVMGVSIQQTCTAGSGVAKVSSRGEGTPNAPRAFADPQASLAWIAWPSLQLTGMRSKPFPATLRPEVRASSHGGGTEMTDSRVKGVCDETCC